MQNIQLNWKVILLVIVLLGSILIFFIGSMKSIDEKTSATIIAGMFTFFAGLTAVLVTQKQIRDREVAEAHRSKKISIYTGFIKTASSLVAGSNKNLDIKAPSEKELVHFLFQYKQDILLWGSPKVIKAQLNFEKMSGQGSNKTLLAVNDIYMAMREDIGLSNYGINDYELVKLSLSDPSEMDSITSS